MRNALLKPVAVCVNNLPEKTRFSASACARQAAGNPTLPPTRGLRAQASPWHMPGSEDISHGSVEHSLPGQHPIWLAPLPPPLLVCLGVKTPATFPRLYFIGAHIEMLHHSFSRQANTLWTRNLWMSAQIPLRQRSETDVYDSASPFCHLSSRCRKGRTLILCCRAESPWV